MRYGLAFRRFCFKVFVGDRPKVFTGPIVGRALLGGVTHLGLAAVSLLFGCGVVGGAWGLARDLVAKLGQQQ